MRGGTWVGLRGECVGEVRGRRGGVVGLQSQAPAKPLAPERRYGKWKKVVGVSASFFFSQFKENLALCYHPNPATANYRDMRGGDKQTG